VKFLKTDGDYLVFQFKSGEKRVFLELLQLYPLVPPNHARVSASAEKPDIKASQDLLEEALAEHRSENKKQLEAMLNEPRRFKETPTGFLLLLSPGQLEWLLQVLNDIRVGSWLRLGSPDEKKGKTLRLSLQNARYFWAMELSGQFQYALMSAGKAGESA
jgi:hypothetical protein